jgi:hypothetical protein
MMGAIPLGTIADLADWLAAWVLIHTDALAYGVALQTLVFELVGGIVVADAPQKGNRLVFLCLGFVFVQVPFSCRLLHALAFRVTNLIFGSEPSRNRRLKLSAPRNVDFFSCRRRPARSMYSIA